MVMILSMSVIRRWQTSCDIRNFVRRNKLNKQNKRLFSCPDKTVSFVINLLNNKTLILLNLAEYRLILADSAYGLVG